MSAMVVVANAVQSAADPPEEVVDAMNSVADIELKLARLTNG